MALSTRIFLSFPKVCGHFPKSSQYLLISHLAFFSPIIHWHICTHPWLSSLFSLSSTQSLSHTTSAHSLPPTLVVRPIMLIPYSPTPTTAHTILSSHFTTASPCHHSHTPIHHIFSNVSPIQHINPAFP